MINRSSWQVPAIFDFMQKAGPVQTEEMFKVFNMGIGYVLVAAPDFAPAIIKRLNKYGETAYQIGRITAGTGKVVLK